MPFGLSNSTSSYQRMMDLVLGDAKFNYLLLYLDVVTVCSRMFEEHLEHSHTVLHHMPEGGLAVHPEKLQLAAIKIDFFGFVVDNGVLKPNPDKLRPIADYPPPRNTKSLQRFLGMILFLQSVHSTMSRCLSATNSVAQERHEMVLRK